MLVGLTLAATPQKLVCFFAPQNSLATSKNDWLYVPAKNF